MGFVCIILEQIQSELSTYPAKANFMCYTANLGSSIITYLNSFKIPCILVIVFVHPQNAIKMWILPTKYVET